MSGSEITRKLRRLIIVLGDQLDRDSPLLQSLDARQDMIFMAEVREEATHVWSHKARIAMFLAAMRHFREDLEALASPEYLASVREARGDYRAGRVKELPRSESE